MVRASQIGNLLFQGAGDIVLQLRPGYEKEKPMLVSMQGMLALRTLRIEFQEGTGEQFPHAALSELLVLYDVCKCLNLNVFQMRDVLGESGWRGVVEYINGPSCDGINWEQVHDPGCSAFTS